MFAVTRNVIISCCIKLAAIALQKKNQGSLKTNFLNQPICWWHFVTYESSKLRLFYNFDYHIITSRNQLSELVTEQSSLPHNRQILNLGVLASKTVESFSVALANQKFLLGELRFFKITCLNLKLFFGSISGPDHLSHPLPVQVPDLRGLWIQRSHGQVTSRFCLLC